VLKSVQHPAVYVGCRYELDVGHGFHLRQDLRRANANADNTELKSASNGWVGVRFFSHREILLNVKHNLWNSL
jgi:hypothetical protein